MRRCHCRCHCHACSKCHEKTTRRRGGNPSFITGFTLALFALTLHCAPSPLPHPREPTDTDQCASACEHLAALGCEEGQPLEDGTTCTAFCEQTQRSGHALRPTCAKQIKTCAELDDCGRDEFPWLREVYRLVADGEQDSAVGILYERVDDLHRQDDLAASDRLIAQVDLERLDTLLLVALLSITSPASSELKNRGRLVERIEARLMELVPDRIEELMQGLR